MCIYCSRFIRTTENALYYTCTFLEYYKSRVRFPIGLFTLVREIV